MIKRLPGWYWTLVLCLFCLGLGLLAPRMLQQVAQNTPQVGPTNIAVTLTPLPSATPMMVAQANTDAPEATATVTLLPPPTLEPPTPTPPPSATPTATSTQGITVNVTLEGIQGLPTATLLPEEEACEPREDWSLEYQVQDNETVTSIANKFGTNSWTLADANCLEDANTIRSGQILLVPGDNVPVEPAIDCSVPYEALQPIENAWGIPDTGTIVFNWRGPRAPRYLLRLYPPDYDFSTDNPDDYIDITFDRRQNETLDLTDIADGGIWHWEVRPLDENFVQACPGSQRWSFTKEQYISPTATPTFDMTGSVGTG